MFCLVRFVVCLNYIIKNINLDKIYNLMEQVFEPHRFKLQSKYYLYKNQYSN